jgi:hypothetical protein
VTGAAWLGTAATAHGDREGAWAWAGSAPRPSLAALVSAAPLRRPTPTRIDPRHRPHEPPVVGCSPGEL